MRILGIFNYYDQNVLRNILVQNNVAALENLIFVNNFEEAEDFIVNHLFANHQHIDLIITADKLIDNPFDGHLVDWIRRSKLDYSRRNFKVKSLPVILYDREIRSSDYYRHGFDATVEKNSYGQHKYFLSAIESVIKASRMKVLDDLELLKIELDDLQNGSLVSLNQYYLLKIKADTRHWAERTQMLSEAFIKNPRPLFYDWLEDTREQKEKDIDQYEGVIKKLQQYNRVNSEKRVLHALYNKAPWMLQLDVYGRPIYEPSLMKNNSQYEEPDYLLPSGFPGIIPTNITEVKPHLIPILQKRKRKPGFKQVFADGLIQVSDYERYARTKMGKDAMNQYLSYQASKLSFTLLASNEKEMDFNHKRIEELRKDHFPKIKLENHNDKLQQVIRYFERSQKRCIL